MTDQPWYLKNYKDQFTAKKHERLLPRIQAVLAEETAKRNAKRDTLHLHPSEMAKDNWCPRSSWYKIMDTEESDPQSFSLSRLNIFAEGNNIHTKWQNWMWKAGGLYGDWSCSTCDYRWEDKSPPVCPVCSSDDIRYREVPISSDEYHIIGHADGLWEDERGKALIEIKSVGLGTIRWEAPSLYEGYEKGDLTLDDLWKRLKRPLKSHLRQINLYMFFKKVDSAIVIYEWKPSQEVKEFQVSFEQSIVDPLLEGAKDVIAHLNTGEVPPRPVSATSKSCNTCRFCNYKTMCWSNK